MTYGNSIWDLDTPALLVDRDILEENIREMASLAADTGISIIPHIKTHKCPMIASMQMAAGATGITAAKLSEAEVFAEAGIDDIFVAFPIIGRKKLQCAVNLSRRIKLLIAVDSTEGADQMSAVAVEEGVRFRVSMEVDIGLGRTGINPANAIELAKYIAQRPGLELEGVFTFRGASYPGRNGIDIEKVGADEGKRIVEVAEGLRKNGVVIRSVSAGSTPTARSVAHIEGVTEIRPGTYVFNDVMQVKAGAADIEHCAGSVLVTVVSCPEPGRAIIDGGSKTFAGDLPLNTNPFHLNGYGHVFGYDGATLVSLSEEHGILRFDSSKASFHVGDKIRIIPNHVCTVVNLFDEMNVIRGDSVVAAWPVAARGHRY